MEKFTSRDHTQVPLYEHSEKDNAKRVIIVGGEMPEFKMGDIKFPETQIQTIQVPFPIKEYEKLEVPVIVKEYETVPYVIKETEVKIVEVPVYITQTEYKTVEIPVVIKEIEFKEIQVPVIRTEYKDISSLVKVALALQFLTAIILMLKK